MESNKLTTVQFCIDNLNKERIRVTVIPGFPNMLGGVHIDEKLFYMTEENGFLFS